MARVDLELMLRILDQLAELVERSKENLPEGSFHPETDEPLDLVGDLQARYAMFEVEYFQGLEAHLKEAISWLDRDVCERVTH